MEFLQQMPLEENYRQQLKQTFGRERESGERDPKFNPEELNKILL